MGQDCC